MRLYCHGCFKSVSNVVPDNTVLRAVAFCPECIERVDEKVFSAVIEQMRNPLISHHLPDPPDK